MSTNIIQMIPIEHGWQACFLIEWDEATRRGTYGVRPVVCMALIREPDRGATTIRPFIARTSGDIVCVDDLTQRFFCLVAPGENARMVVATVDAAYQAADWYEKQEVS